MGAIRTLLALAVVFAHTFGFVFVGGQLAVQLFYVISGFLISYILVEVRTYNQVSRFYVNRFLRLFPIYWIVATLTFIIYSAAALSGGNIEFFEVYKNIDFLGFCALLVSNVIIFGQDWIMFTGVENGIFHFVSDFKQTEIKVWNGLLIPQAWTLGIELSFYLIAPFVLKNKKIIVGLLCISLLIRGYLLSIGLGFRDPWTYRFFPAELALFLLGALSHQILKPLYIDFLGEKLLSVSRVCTVLVFFYCFIFFMLPFRLINTFVLMALFILLLPLLFEFQRSSNLDRRIGDLSYPIYISHMMVIPPIDSLLSSYAGEHLSLVKAFVVVMVTLVFSYVIDKYVGERIEFIRQKIKKR